MSGGSGASDPVGIDMTTCAEAHDSAAHLKSILPTDRNDRVVEIPQGVRRRALRVLETERDHRDGRHVISNFSEPLMRGILTVHM